MDGGKWTKSPPELVELFQSVFPPEPARMRQMFGYPAGFVNGNMFMSLHQDSFIVRLGEADRKKLLNTDGARLFEPMEGKPMKEYVVLPQPVLSSKTKLKNWVAKAFEYGISLPAKKPKQPASRRR